MARVYVKSQREPLIISNERAIPLKKIHKNFRETKEDVWLDIDNWSGYTSRITEITLDEERKYSGVPLFKEMTPEEIKRSDEARIKVRENLFGKKNK